jgi:antitoxin (DNA-binding transcriptional repressor) of toxin-antitoxin stability system
MDKTYPSEECRRRWRDVLDHVQGGGTALITRHGKVMARLTPVAPESASLGVRVGTRWGDLTPEQRAGVPVGTRAAWPDGGDVIVKHADGWYYEDDPEDPSDGRLDDRRIITHLPERE